MADRLEIDGNPTLTVNDGATYSAVPIINRRASGSTAGVGSASGNAGAIVLACLFMAEALTTEDTLVTVGVAVVAASVLVFLGEFSPVRETGERRAVEGASAARGAIIGAAGAGTD